MGLLSFLLVMGFASVAAAQFVDLSKAGKGGVVPKGVDRYGEYEVTWVKSPIDAQKLLEIASPTIFDRANPPEGKIPVEIRAQAIEERLNRELLRLAGIKGKTSTTQPSMVEIATLNNRPVLLVTNPQATRSLKLITVTEPDAEYHSETLETLAEQWRAILQKEVNRQAELINPDVLLHRISQALLIFLTMLVTTALLWGLRRLIRRRKQTLKAQQQPSTLTKVESPGATVVGVEEEPPTDEVAAERSRFLAHLGSPVSLRRQLALCDFFQWLVFWLLISIWYFGIYLILTRIPVLMRYSGWALAVPLRLLFIWFSLSLTIRVCRWLIDRVMHALQNSALLSLGEAERQSLRTSTVTLALKGLITFIFVAVGIVWTLDLLNIPTGSILAGGAILGLAVSFGSQNLIKDLVNGCLILVEDQFAVGDVIDLGDARGMVENMNLRITQLRNSEGELITIPNSAITKVRNLTRLWSRLDFTIEVAYENDPQKVLALLEEVAIGLYNEPEWHQRISAPPQVLGLDNLSPKGMSVRVWIKTAPLQQWSVGREYRLRVRQAFEANEIKV